MFFKNPEIMSYLRLLLGLTDASKRSLQDVAVRYPDCDVRVNISSYESVSGFWKTKHRLLLPASAGRGGNYLSGDLEFNRSRRKHNYVVRIISL